MFKKRVCKQIDLIDMIKECEDDAKSKEIREEEDRDRERKS